MRRSVHWTVPATDLQHFSSLCTRRDMQASSAGKGKYEDAKRMAADRRRRMAEALVAEQRAEERRAAALATVTAVKLRSRTSEDDEQRRAKSAKFLKFRTGPAGPGPAATAVDESPVDHDSDNVKLFIVN